MNKIEKCKAARDYHTHGCNCAQSILAAFHEDMGFTEDQCMALAGGMGGGMRCGSICGACRGMQAVEEKWYSYWENNGLFHGKPNPDKKPYSIVIPPPQRLRVRRGSGVLPSRPRSISAASGSGSLTAIAPTCSSARI